MMLTKILIFAWTFGIINQRTTPVLIDCLTRVQKCPIGKEAWAIKNDRYRCKGSETYVCIQDSNRNLYEGCMSNFTIQANSGNCPVLIVCVKNKPYLGLKESYFPCPEEDPGCPAKSHPEYSIQELYKYPRCSGSQVFLNTSRTRQDSTTSGFNSTKDHVQGQGHTYIIVILVVIPVIILCSMIGCFLVSKRCKGTTNGNYESVSLRPSERLELRNTARHQENSQANTLEDQNNRETQLNGFKALLLFINEAETGKIQILPLNPGDTVDLDKIYVPVTLLETRFSRSDRREVAQEVALDNLLDVQKEKPTRFIFILGEAGYGKTVQCQRIVKSWCHICYDESAEERDQRLKGIEKSLEQFQFLFFVRMRDVKSENTHLKDIVCEAYSNYNNEVSSKHTDTIRNILEDQQKRCLILLDGLDEWNILEWKKKDLNGGIPFCTYMPSCTILITMRSWKFLEVANIYREKYDRVARLQGLNNDSNEELTSTLLINYYQIQTDSEEFRRKRKRIRDVVSSASSDMTSLMRIPLLAIFCILTLYEDVETGYTLTTLYLSMIESLIKRFLKKNQKSTERDAFSQNVPSILANYLNLNHYMSELTSLGKLAFENLTSKISLELTTDQLHGFIGEENMELFLGIGLVIKEDSKGRIHEDKVCISFLHKTIQEFAASLYIWNSRAEEDILNEVSNIEKALEFSSILVFLSGLSPSIGGKISTHIQKLLLKDKDTNKYREYFTGEYFRKFFYLFDFQMKCYREARGTKSIKDFIDDMPECKFEVSDIVLLSQDTIVQTIRESADILRHQANDVKSLYMLCIPDDNKEGIANEELNAFLEKNQSIESLNIDGYVDGKCRLFREISPRISSLRTLGLWNVAFSNDILNNLLTANEAKMNIRALGLFNIASPSNLDAQFEYQFSSIHMPFNSWCAFLKEKVHSQRAAKCPPHSAASANPILKNILDTLPKFEHLSTLYVTYMEADPDRRALLRVFPDLKVLQTVGYIGSALRPRTDEDYDAEVINIILNAYYLKDIHLDEITLTKKGLKFKETSEVEGIWLQRFNMNESDWEVFVKSISGIKALRLRKVLLFNTNIGKTNAKELKQSQQSVMIDRYEF